MVKSCAGSLEPSAPTRREKDDPDFTARCPSCGHAVEVFPLEPGETEHGWRFAYHDTEGSTLVQRSRGDGVPWRERVVGLDDF